MGPDPLGKGARWLQTATGIPRRPPSAADLADSGGRYAQDQNWPFPPANEIVK
jgi:hypothetical protein